MRNRRPRSGWRREDTPKGRPQCRNTAPPKARAVRRHGTPRKRRRGAHEARALCAKQRGVSPMKQGVPQASLRAQWYDHAELRNGAKRKNTFPPRLLAVEAREAVRRQAIGKSRPQTAGLWAISPSGQCCSPGGFLCAFAAKNSLASRGLCGIINAKIHFPMEG